MTQKTKYAKYILGAVIVVALITGASVLDTLCRLPVCSVSVKLLLVVALVILGVKKGVAPFGRCDGRYYLLVLIPFVFSLLMSVGRLNAAPTAAAVIFGFLGVLTTVLVEELYYRASVLHFFKGEAVTYKLVAIVSLIFCLLHAVNYFFAEPLAVTLQLAVAFGLGLFTTGLFLRTRNVAVPTVGHFLLNGTSLFFGLLSADGGFIGGVGYVIVCAAMAVTLSVVGLFLTKGELNKTI